MSSAICSKDIDIDIDLFIYFSPRPLKDAKIMQKSFTEVSTCSTSVPSSSWCSGELGFIDISGAFCCRFIALRLGSPQTEAEWLQSPEESGNKVKLSPSVVHPWNRRVIPACGHHPQNTHWVSYALFHVLHTKPRPRTHTPVPRAICTACSTDTSMLFDTR